jgi:hypothetical protein
MINVLLNKRKNKFMADKKTTSGAKALDDRHHPLRIMANRIIDEVIDFNYETMYSTNRQRVEDDIVALLTNLD